MFLRVKIAIIVENKGFDFECGKVVDELRVAVEFFEDFERFE